VQPGCHGKEDRNKLMEKDFAFTPGRQIPLSRGGFPDIPEAVSGRTDEEAD
jgi:hypothetical protein